MPQGEKKTHLDHDITIFICSVQPLNMSSVKRTNESKLTLFLSSRGRWEILRVNQSLCHSLQLQHSWCEQTSLWAMPGEFISPSEFTASFSVSHLSGNQDKLCLSNNIVASYSLP